MNIPPGINHLKFLESVQKNNPGVQITSRFPGVSMHLVKGRAPKWWARISVNGNYKSLGLFPFNAHGEKAASEAYEAALKEAKLEKV